MGKKSDLTAKRRAQLVIRLLSKEEPAAQIARRGNHALWRRPLFCPDALAPFVHLYPEMIRTMSTNA